MLSTPTLVNCVTMKPPIQLVAVAAAAPRVRHPSELISELYTHGTLAKLVP